MTSVALWDLKNGMNLWEHRCGLFKKIGFSPNGKELFAIGTAGVNRNLTSKVISANVDNGEFREIFREKFRLRFWDFDIAPDGGTIICSGGYYHEEREDVPIIIVDLNSERKKVKDKHGTYFTKSVLTQLIGHTSTVNSVTYSPDGRIAVSTSDDIRIWDIESSKQIQKIDIYTRKVTFSLDGSEILFFNRGKLYFYDVVSWRLKQEKKIF